MSEERDFKRLERILELYKELNECIERNKLKR